FGYRVRLNFDTSFTGEDLLRTRLQAVDVPNLNDFDLNNTLMARTAIGGNSDGVEIDDLYYRFPAFNGRAQFYIGANSLDLEDTMDVVTPFNSSGTASISRFGQRNPTIFRGPEGTGAAAKFAFGGDGQFKLNLSYLAGNAADATEGNGLFNGGNTGSAQFVFEPTDELAFGLEYARKYFTNGDVNISGGTGSWIADRPFGDNSSTSDNLGFQFNWRVVEKVELGGWFGATWANQKNNGDDSATILNWAVTLGFPDAFSEGDLGGIVFGMPPKVTSHDTERLEDGDTSLHIEAFYRYAFNDYISITPGFYVVTNPDHSDINDTIVVGTLRTTFRF
ncbi:MAG: iron uptake porin, partial [Limnospira sp.]